MVMKFANEYILFKHKSLVLYCPGFRS
jgi:hypothetical protein